MRWWCEAQRCFLCARFMQSQNKTESAKSVEAEENEAAEADGSLPAAKKQRY